MAIVRFERSQIPPMSEERKAELRALAQRPDSEIDFSDIPELTEDFWKNAKPLAELHQMDKLEEDERELQGLFGQELVSWLLKHGKNHKAQLQKLLQQFALQHS